MPQNVIHHERLTVLADLDVLVVGGGSAGCCAALAAAEKGRAAGLRVGLIERYGFLGGCSTQVLDTFYGFYTPGDAPKKIVGGVPDCVVDRLDQSGDVFLRPNTYGAGTGITYNPERLKLVWDRLLEDAGVTVWLHTSIVEAELKDDQTAGWIVVSTKNGFYRITASRFIDASGDADLCHLLGSPYEKAGEVEPAQTLTTTFRMANVDLAAFECAGGKEMLSEEMERAIVSSTHLLPRKSGSAHRMVQTGCIATVAVRVARFDPNDFEQLGDAEREGRRQAFLYEEFFRDRVPGYEDAKIIGLSHSIGVRESRRVKGHYWLTREDCLEARQFDDAVFLCGAPIEDHRPSKDGEVETVWEYVQGNQAYGVPYRTLVPQGLENVWVAGRCFSASHDAHASCRSMGQTMSMGQAVGLAAALSHQSGAGSGEISIRQLQEELLDLGAVLELPKDPDPSAATVWRRSDPQESTP